MSSQLGSGLELEGDRGGAKTSRHGHKPQGETGVHSTTACQVSLGARDTGGGLAST